MRITNRKFWDLQQLTSSICRDRTIRRIAGFTLVELLVVISIIALLLAMLMPALSKARNQAWRVLCRSNLHQTGLGIVMYAQEHKNKFSAGNWFNYPISNFGDSNRNGKHHESEDGGFIALDIAPYLATKDFSIYICPANKTIARMPAYSAEQSTNNMTTYQWYKTGHLNFDGPPNFGYFIYFYYFGNYPWEDRYSIVSLLTYKEQQQKNKGLIYPTTSLGPRAKIMQDIVTDTKTDKQFKDSHAYPDGLYTDGSVESLKPTDLKVQRRPSINMTHYW